MLTEQTGYKLDVLPDGRMKVHKMTYVMKDGVQIAEVYGAYSDYVPGQFDDPKAVLPDAPVKAMTDAVWTREVKEAYAAKIAAQIAEKPMEIPAGVIKEPVEESVVEPIGLPIKG